MMLRCKPAGRVRPSLFFQAVGLVVVFVGSGSVRADLFVVDSSSDAVMRFNAQTGDQISPNFVSLSFTTGIAIGPDKNLYVAHSNPSEIFRYNATTGAPVDTNSDHSAKPFVFFEGASPGPDPHDVQGPEAIRVGSNGTLYVADVTLSNVHVYDPMGASVTSLTSPDLDQPTGITLDSSGNLYVGSGFSTILRSAGGTQPFTTFVPQQSGGLNNPGALTFGPDGKLYVLDFFSDKVYRYNADGTFDKIVVDASQSMFSSSDLAFGPDGNLYISGIDFSSNGEIARYLPNGTPDGALVSLPDLQPTFITFNDVPEPTGGALAGIAAIGLLTRRRKNVIAGD